MDLNNVNWNVARTGVLAVWAGAFAHAVVKKNPIMPAILLSMDLAEDRMVAREAGKGVWYDDLRCCRDTALYGCAFWLPMKLEIE